MVKDTPNARATSATKSGPKTLLAANVLGPARSWQRLGRTTAAKRKRKQRKCRVPTKKPQGSCPPWERNEESLRAAGLLPGGSKKLRHGQRSICSERGGASMAGGQTRCPARAWLMQKLPSQRIDAKCG